MWQRAFIFFFHSATKVHIIEEGDELHLVSISPTTLFAIGCKKLDSLSVIYVIVLLVESNIKIFGIDGKITPLSTPVPILDNSNNT